jgi:hypothetical protein
MLRRRSGGKAPELEARHQQQNARQESERRQQSKEAEDTVARDAPASPMGAR